MKTYLGILFENYPELIKSEKSIKDAINLLIRSYESENKLLIAGNGGSASDAEHIVGELMKSFVLERPLDQTTQSKILEIDHAIGQKLNSSLQSALPAIALTGHSSLTTAFNNDVDSVYSFAQQVLGYGKENDVFLGLSTSGTAENIYAAAVIAKAIGMKVIILTGKKESRLSHLADINIHAPSEETYRVQEFHLPIYHAICLELEEHFYGTDK